MSDYYDSKGVRHSSEWDRDSANRKYLSEERDARNKHTELLQQHARLQAEQLRVAEGRAREQRAHDKRIEDLAREQAAKEEAQRRFTRDLAFLEHESPADRKAFFIKRTLEETDIGQIRVDKKVIDNLLHQMNSVIGEFTPAIASLSDAVRRHQVAKADIKSINSERSILAKQKAAHDYCQGGLAISVIAILVAAFYGWASLFEWNNTHATKWTVVVFACVLVFAVAIGAMLHYIKKGLAIKKECGGGAPEKLLKDLGGRLRKAKSESSTLAKLQASIETKLVSDVFQRVVIALEEHLLVEYFHPGWYQEQFRARLVDFQSQFPKRLQVAPGDVTRQDLEAAYTAFSGTAVKVALQEAKARVWFSPETQQFQSLRKYVRC